MSDTLSIFSGIGGLDLGARLAGLEIGLSVDSDEKALQLLNQALGHPVLEGRIEQLNPDEVIERAQLQRGQGYLIGGPPCTPFSHAGFWLRRKREGLDADVARVFDYLSYVRHLRPAAFVMENVPGLLFKNYKSIFDAIVARAEELRYKVSYAVLNTAEFGVPQNRRRLIVVGVRSRKPFRFPRGLFLDGNSRTAGWAFEDLTDVTNRPEDDEQLCGRYSSLLPLVPPGENYLHFTSKKGYSPALFKWRSRYWSFLLKLHPERPSPTIPATRVTNNGPFHWENRHLRIRELARLQGFPDDYPLPEIVLARRYIGNAVPPLFAAEVIWALRVFLGEVRETERPPALAAAANFEASAEEVSRAISNVLTIGG